MRTAFCTVAACTLVAALAAPAVSSAQDRDSAATSSLAGTTSAVQDLRAPDSRDAANGRGTLGAPAATVVKLPEPPQAAPVRGNPAIDRDGGMYAVAALLGTFLLAVGGTALVQRRRGGAWVASAA
jgi:hypothetical protein